MLEREDHKEERNLVCFYEENLDKKMKMEEILIIT